MGSSRRITDGINARYRKFNPSRLLATLAIILALFYGLSRIGSLPHANVITVVEVFDGDSILLSLLVPFLL